MREIECKNRDIVSDILNEYTVLTDNTILKLDIC